MTTKTLTLTDFLLVRIAEDETVARACDRNGWSDPAAMWATEGGTSVLVNPARVLAECEAKRRIVDETATGTSLYDYERDGLHDRGTDRALDWVSRVLALSYADHPDYRQEWKP